MKNAVIAIEDRRFYSHKGVDYTGIARAFGQDILKRRAAQGGSTITQQFVKNALAAQGDRSVFQKLREAALAYHLERKWSKEKILTQYLNTVYFGNGAYGIESAVRTYFGTGDPPSEREGAADTGVSYTPPVAPEDQPDPNAREADERRPARGRAARGDDLLAEHVRPGPAPAGGDGAAEPGAPAHAGHAHDHAGAVRHAPSGRASPRRTTSTRRRSSRSSPTSRAG